VNIFYLDSNPLLAAQAHCDGHVGKMIVEHLQMMSVALASHGLPTAIKKDGTPYSATAYKNHPCTKWVGENFNNFCWVYNTTAFLCEEFRLLYGKEHAGQKSLSSIASYSALEISKKFPCDSRGTPPAQAMPDDCKNPDPVVAYRTYYHNHKAHMASWTRRPQPSWWMY